jgi:hypothetical protein
MNRKVFGIVFFATLLLGVWFYFQAKVPNAVVTGRDQIEVNVDTSAKTIAADTKVAEVAIPVIDALTTELKQSEKKLPTLEQAKTWPEEEIHSTPIAIMESGKEIGKLIDAAEKNPERREPTLKYFLKCAENKDILPSVRAVCWKSLTQNIPEWKVFVPLADAHVPESIRVLSGKL